MSEPVIQDAMDAVEKFFMDEKSYREYLNRQAAILDYNSGVNAARAEGLAEGRAEGEINTVLAFLRINTPIERISEATGWSEEKIKNLAHSGGVDLWKI